jgi:1,4-dihydroxy-2-naphthoate octaprenyltransferase
LNKKFVKPFDYFFVLRPTLFFPVWTIALAGLWSQDRFGNSIQHLSYSLHKADFTVIIYLGLYTLLMGGAFLLNQLEDVETDRLNKKLFLIADGEIKGKNAIMETIFITLFPIIFFLFSRADLAILFMISFLVMGWMYSSRPLVLKDRPIGGIIANMLGGYIVFSFGWMIFGSYSVQMLLNATPYVLGMLAVYFFTTLPDRDGDGQTNKVTIAVKYNMKFVLYGAVLLDISSIIAGIVIRDWVVLFPTTLILPFFLYSAFKKSNAEVLRTNKFAALFLSLTICVRFPFYLLIITGLFFFSRWYYKARFNMNYPSFSKN